VRASRMMCLSVLLCHALPCTVRAEGTASGTAAVADSEILKRGLVSLGDTARVQRVLAKARRGEKVVVSVIGGSITQGASASAEDRRYGNVMAAWWRATFPKAEIAFVNAGIGATGSDIGAHRARTHLLCHKPDFVVIEYAVNDGGIAIAAETLEGLVRQILKQPNQPAVMLLFTMTKTGDNVQDRHIPIGGHYGLPMVSFRDALWPEVKADRIKWTDIEADEVHPNDRGHRYCADLISMALGRVLADLPADAELPRPKAVPAPKISDVFEHADFVNAATITPKRNEGWEVLKDHPFMGFFGPGWKATATGSVLEFEVEGTAIGVLFWRIKGSTGMAEAQVDDLAPVKMDGWFGATWGGYTPYQLVARDLKPGKHTLRIRVLDEKNAESGGHEFRVQAIMRAGLTGRP
jgi:lysophospholipase L1-like esterase